MEEQLERINEKLDLICQHLNIIEPKKKYNKLNNEITQQVYQLKKENKTLKYISDHLGISIYKIKIILNNMPDDDFDYLETVSD